jgi:soluble lytic murein transglycosylase-like protein
MRNVHLRLPLLVLATLSGLSCSIWVDAPASPAAALAGEPSSEPTADAELDTVRTHLSRHAKRTGLTDAEITALSHALVSESRRYGLDPRLVLAVMHVESRYDSFAVSEKDAMGLMQILPTTGEWLAAQVGVVWQGPQTLFDPIANVRLGVAYLSRLLHRYDGDLAAALAAYNWGPGHIDGRLRDGTPLPAAYPALVLRAYGRQSTSS